MLSGSLDDASECAWNPSVTWSQAAAVDTLLPGKRWRLCRKEINSELPLSCQAQFLGFCLFPQSDEPVNKRRVADVSACSTGRQLWLPAHTDDDTVSKSRKNEDGDVFQQPRRMRTDSVRRVPRTESIEPLPVWTMDQSTGAPHNQVGSCRPTCCSSAPLGPSSEPGVGLFTVNSPVASQFFFVYCCTNFLLTVAAVLLRLSDKHTLAWTQIKGTLGNAVIISQLTILASSSNFGASIACWWTGCIWQCRIRATEIHEKVTLCSQQQFIFFFFFLF